MKKIIRLTENDLHRIVKESVKRILREGKYDLPGGEFDSFQCATDMADDEAQTPEEYYEKLKTRDKYARIGGENHWSNDPANPNNHTGRNMYVHPEAFEHTPESVLGRLKDRVKYGMG